MSGESGLVVTDSSSAERAIGALRVEVKEIDQVTFEAARMLASVDGRVLERDGLAIFAIGVCSKVVVPGVDDNAVRDLTNLLHQIATRSGGGFAPIAVAALRFDLETANEFVIGEITVLRRGSDPAAAIFVGDPTEITALRARDLAAEAVLAQRQGSESPDHFALEAVISHSAFIIKVEDALRSIGSGRLEKVVLAREVAVNANRPFVRRDLLSRLRALHPSCLSFAIDGFIGATPELLLRKDGARATSIPLAGTIARSGDPDEDQRLSASLMASAKDREEHQFVIGEICRHLEPYAHDIDVPTAPHILELRNVVHLATAIEAKVDLNAASSLEIAAALHPTPAVCGVPREVALDYIATNEGFCRDHYAGLVGYVDARGDGEWWIGIRSAIVDGTRARMFAGVGIVAGSDPAAELAETQLKLQAMLAVLVRP